MGRSTLNTFSRANPRGDKGHREINAGRRVYHERRYVLIESDAMVDERTTAPDKRALPLDHDYSWICLWWAKGNTAMTRGTVTTRGGNSANALGSDEADEFWQECVRLRSGLVRAASRFGAEADAEDIVHEAFLRAARYGELDLERLNFFLAAVTRRLCVDDLRRRVALQAVAGHPRVRLPPADDPEDTVLCREEARWLIAKFGRLSERERFVLLQLERGVPHDEIARLLGTTRRATESIASRARCRVRELIARRARCDRVLGD